MRRMSFGPALTGGIAAGLLIVCFAPALHAQDLSPRAYLITPLSSLFTKNPDFFSRNQYVQGTHEQTQAPIAAFETHLSYDFRPRLWVSLDGNFWWGGRTSLDGVENPATLQEASRIGVTAAFPVSRHQSIKVGYADGAYVRFGGDYRIASVAWQYSWVGKPR